jgi:hypothetical protein
MIFNCKGCGISVSTHRNKCIYCKSDNTEYIELITGIKANKENVNIGEKIKGSIFSFVHR